MNPELYIVSNFANITQIGHKPQVSTSYARIRTIVNQQEPTRTNKNQKQLGGGGEFYHFCNQNKKRMDKKSPEVVELRHRIELAIHRKLKTPSDFDYLTRKVWEEMHETISISTLKRLWGYVDGASKTRNSTLNLLSRYIGYQDWDDFLLSLENENDIPSEKILTPHIETRHLKEGDMIEVAWQPNRHCHFRYLGNRTFFVEKSSNSKLKVGNTFMCSLFVYEEPLYMENLTQEGHPPIAFVVGNKSGLTLLKLTKSTEDESSNQE